MHSYIYIDIFRIRVNEEHISQYFISAVFVAVKSSPANHITAITTVDVR